MSSGYWEDCVSEAFEDANIAATQGQIDTVVSWVAGCHENYGMAHGHDCIPNPLQAENEKLSRELKAEREKVWCEDCSGKGYIVSNFGTRSSESSCYRCHGTGRRMRGERR